MSTIHVVDPRNRTSSTSTSTSTSSAGTLLGVRTDRRTLLTGGAALLGAAALSVGTVQGAEALPMATAPVLQRGSRGSAVVDLQNRLTAKGYWCGAADGVFGQVTQQAVWAVQKRNGLTRDGVVGSITRSALANGTRLAPVGGSGTRIEIHLKRQLLLVVKDGRTRWMYNTSTGNNQYYWLDGRRYLATTPTGRYQVYSTYSKGWQWGPLGSLYRPMYFNGGIAVHGSASIPTWPDSHGCCRVSTSAMDKLWSSGAMVMGRRVLVV